MSVEDSGGSPDFCVAVFSRAKIENVLPQVVRFDAWLPILFLRANAMKRYAGGVGESIRYTRNERKNTVEINLYGAR